MGIEHVALVLVVLNLAWTYHIVQATRRNTRVIVKEIQRLAKEKRGKAT